MGERLLPKAKEELAPEDPRRDIVETSGNELFSSRELGLRFVKFGVKREPNP